MRSGGLFEVADEGVFKGRGSAGADEVRRRVGRQYPAGIHQRDAVAKLGFVHEMGGDENRHPLISRQVDQQLPEGVARQRIDAGRRLVENEHVRLVHDGNGERQPLADAERQIGGKLVEIIGKSELLDEAGEALFRLLGRQMEQPCVQVEILPHGQLGVQRERLRHVADTPARFDVAGVGRRTEQERFAFGRRQKTGEHLHGGGLAAAVGADEPEDLAALDVEADTVDCREVAEAAGQVARSDHGLVAGDTRRNLQPLVPGAAVLWHQRDESVFHGLRVRLRLDLGRRTGREDLSIVHGHEVIETLGFFHVRRGDDHAHADASRADAIDQLPELSPRQRIDTGGGFIENEKIRIVNERAAEAELLPHAARQFLRRPVGEGREPGAVQKLGNPPMALGARLPEHAAEEFHVFADAQIGIEVFSQPLRHIGDARADRGAVRGARDVASQHKDASRLDLPRAGDDAQQRRLADAVGADQADHAAAGQVDRDRVERRHASVTLGDIFQTRDGRDSPVHCAAVPCGVALPCSAAGHFVAGSVRT